MGRWQGHAVALSALMVTVGCGDEKAPDSTIDSGVTAGTAGTAGAAGSLALGNKGGMGGAGGMVTSAPPTVTLHACAMPEQPCATKVHTGDVVVQSKEQAMALMGVTSIVGNLTVSPASNVEVSATIVDAFNCLETVGGDVSIDFSSAQGDVSLWGLRNLKTIDGNLKISNVLDRTYTDCGLAYLQRVGLLVAGTGSIEVDGLAGALDLSQLSELNALHVMNTELASIKLPVSGMFYMSELEIENNRFLAEVAGFDAVTVDTDPAPLGDVVRIVNNPRLSDCRAEKIGQLFIAGGADLADIALFGNLACLME